MLQLQIPEKHKHTYWNRLYGSSLALSIVETSRNYNNGPLVIIVEDVIHADVLTKEEENPLASVEMNNTKPETSAIKKETKKSDDFEQVPQELKTEKTAISEEKEEIEE